MFIIDILINFRTTYVCENDEVISQVRERQILLLEGGCVDSILEVSTKCGQGRFRNSLS